MKKKIIFTLILAVAVCMTVAPARAATVSLSPVTQDVLLGGTVLVDVMIDFDTTGGSVDITYDNSVLDYTGTVFTAGLAFAQRLPTETATGGVGDLSGLLNDLANGDFPSLIPVASLPGSIAQLSFTAIGLGDTLLAVGNGNGTYGNFGQNPVFAGATVNVNAVPIPATMLLFGSSIFGLVGLRRMKRS